MHYSTRQSLKNRHRTLVLKSPAPALIQVSKITLHGTCPSPISSGYNQYSSHKDHLPRLIPAQHHELLSPTLCFPARPAWLLAPVPCWDRRQEESFTGPGEHTPRPTGPARQAAGRAETRSHPIGKPTRSRRRLQLRFPLHVWFLLHHPIQALNYAHKSTRTLDFRNFSHTVFYARQKKKKKAALKSSSPSTSK